MIGLLASPMFLLSVIILAINDFYLKYAFPGIITGKLSDFSGLFALNIFLVALFHIRVRTSEILTALLFVIWKSSLSQPLINFINSLTLGFEVARVIDPSDLVALVIIPIGSFYIHTWKANNTNLSQSSGLWRGRIALPFAALAIAATSVPAPLPIQKYWGVHFGTYDFAEGSKVFKIATTAAALTASLKRRGLQVYQYSGIGVPSCPTKLVVSITPSCCSQPIEENRSKINNENESSLTLPPPAADCNRLVGFELELQYTSHELLIELSKISACDHQSPLGKERLSSEIISQYINPAIQEFISHPIEVSTECTAGR